MITLMNPKLLIAGGLLIVVLSLLTWGMWERSGKIRIQAEYDGFVADAKAIAAVQLAERQRKEKENDARIKSAESDRDAALERLRHAAEDSRRLRASITPAATEGTGRVCFDRERLDAALQQFLGEIEGIVGEGQAAVIETRAWLSSWPR